MPDLDVIGRIVETEREERTTIEWKIAEFLSVAETKDELNSPIFSFGDGSWYLELSTNRIFNKVQSFYLCLLKKEGILERGVEYKLGTKKSDGSIEQLSRGVFLRNTAWVGAFLVKLPEAEQQNSLEPSSDMLIITCKLKRETTQNRVARVKTDELIKLDTLSENLKNIFASKESCDTTLHVMDKEFKAHRIVLMARSSVFAAMFQHETSEKQTRIITIPDCDPDSFGQFLEFLYSGKLKNLSSCSALQLYETSEKYDVQELKIFCSEFLVKNFTVENFCDIAILADKYGDETLMSKAQYFFNKKKNRNFCDV